LDTLSLHDALPISLNQQVRIMSTMIKALSDGDMHQRYESCRALPDTF
jgi:hypothetical protein